MSTAAGIALCPIALSAQEVMLASYETTLGPLDYYDPVGRPHRTLKAIIEQDRANFHSLGIRHEFDQTDPLFSTDATRAQIKNVPVTMCCGLAPHILKAEALGYSPFVGVTVFGIEDRVTRIILRLPG